MFIKVKPDLASTHNENTLKITLAAGTSAPTSGDAQPADLLPLVPWEGLLRTAKTFNNAPGTWTLNAWLDGGSRLDSAAIEEIVMICRYKCASQGFQ